MNKLAGVHPKLVARIERVLAAMEALGHPMMVTDGVRTDEEQQRLFAQGRTAPGKIVTRADGIKAKSNHQLQADGTGHAVDCTFVGPDGKPRWLDTDPWTAYGACAKALGLKWGGDWPKNKADRPHVELP
jgi:peptidoglycan L-alanyl-D-glutamate endopeptidase CwlK